MLSMGIGFFRSFRSPDELVGYLHAQRNARDRGAHIAIRYLDMAGELLRSRLPLDPAKCQGHTFLFRATAVFGLFGRGLVFRGAVVCGEIGVGALVTVVGDSRQHNARIAAIEFDRKLIETSKLGAELGILLTDFEDTEIQAILALGLQTEDAMELPTPRQLLGIQFPVELHNAT